jgi:hypothetical protein
MRIDGHQICSLPLADFPRLIECFTTVNKLVAGILQGLIAFRATVRLYRISNIQKECNYWTGPTKAVG